jgi:hypothetical protein
MNQQKKFVVPICPQCQKVFNKANRKWGGYVTLEDIRRDPQVVEKRKYCSWNCWLKSFAEKIMVFRIKVAQKFASFF